MSSIIIVAIGMSFVAMALFASEQGLKDKIPGDHDPARGSVKRNFTLAIVAAVAAAIAWIAALTQS